MFRSLFLRAKAIFNGSPEVAAAPSVSAPVPAALPGKTARKVETEPVQRPAPARIAAAAAAPARQLPAPKAQPAAPKPQPAVAKRQAPAAEAARRGRPIAPAMQRALELVSASPDITAQELAKALKISPAYGRTLLRRAKTRTAETAKPAKAAAPAPQKSARRVTPVAAIPVPAPAVSAPPAPVPVLVPAVPTPADPGLKTVVAELANRLNEAEGTLQMLRVSGAHKPAGWDLNRRNEVIRRSLAGEAPQIIASGLGIASGEVAFILKVHRMLSGAA